MNTATLEITAASIVAPAINNAKESTAKVGPTITVSGKKVEVAAIEKRLRDIQTAAGRLTGEAESLGLGKIAKTLGGKARRVIDPTVARQLHTLGRINPDKAKSLRIVNEIKALEMISEAFELLGLAAREIV